MMRDFNSVLGPVNEKVLQGTYMGRIWLGSSNSYRMHLWWIPLWLGGNILGVDRMEPQ